jgi:peptide/nickel transport system substrate-binding protein
MRQVRIAIIVLLAFCFVAGCNQETPPPKPAVSSAPPAYGDAAVSGSIGEASNLIPILATDASSHEVADHVYNGLLKYDKNLELTGSLAESWTVSPDGLTITFRLRRGVRWHDGAPFTSRDVLYTYRVVVDPKTPTAYAGDYRQVQRAEAPDLFTFRVTYATPFAPALSSWTLSILPAHLLEGKDITKSPLSRNPVGTGPYRFKEWKQGQQIVLEANADYFEGRPYLDRRIVRVIPDSSTMFMELKAGGVDLMGLTPVQYARQTDGRDFTDRFNRFRYPSKSYTYLGYNLENPLFTDRRVRQAITHALDKAEIVHGVLLGMGRPAHGPFLPGTWAYNPGIRELSYDPAKALALLREAGWERSPGDGILTKGGRPFSFTILTNQGNAERLKTAQIIQRRLREIGIDVKIRVVEWASFITQFIDKRRFETVLLGWALSPEPDPYDIWHSSKTGPKELNFVGYRNPEVDRLLDEGRRTYDVKHRQKAYWRIQELLLEDQPYTFLYVPDALPVVHARIRGIEPAPAGIGHNTIHWYVPKSEQLY